MAAPLLTLAGRKRTVGAPGAWSGGAVVQLNSDGSWVERSAGGTAAWNLQNFELAAGHVMFHIRSDGFGVLNTPDRGALYRSTDKGATWADVTPSSGAAEYAGDIAKDADGNLWLLTSELAAQNTTPNNQPSRIYKSANAGATWTLSYAIPEVSFVTRTWPAFNITCHPTDADIVLVEGAEMVGNASRLWRTTDGGATWSAAFAPETPDPPSQVLNTSGAKQHVFNYTAAGDLVYAGIFETANDDLFVLKSLSGNNGGFFGLYHTEVSGLAYGAAFQEATLVYILTHKKAFQSAAPVGPGQVTEIASNADAPFDFHGLSRHAVGGVDTLHIGVNNGAPGGGGTADPSIFTRPADLSSAWVQHTSWSRMQSDLGYRLYVAINGVVGATELTADTVRPLAPREPPGGGGPVGEPRIGPTRVPKQPQPRPRRAGQRVDVTVPRKRGTQMVTDRLPRSARQPAVVEPAVLRWMEFGWLSPAVVEGHKTMTLRDWGQVEGAQWRQGELFYAYDDPPSAGGRKLALLRVSTQPYEDTTAALKPAAFQGLGLEYAVAHRLAPPHGVTAVEMWESWHANPRRLWVVRFTVERIYDQLAPQAGTVHVSGWQEN